MDFEKEVLAMLQRLTAGVEHLCDRVERLEERTATLRFQVYASVAADRPWAWGVVDVGYWDALVAREPSMRRVGGVTTYAEARAIVDMLEARSSAGHA